MQPWGLITNGAPATHRCCYFSVLTKLPPLCLSCTPEQPLVVCPYAGWLESLFFSLLLGFAANCMGSSCECEARSWLLLMS